MLFWVVRSSGIRGEGCRVGVAAEKVVRQGSRYAFPPVHPMRVGELRGRAEHNEGAIKSNGRHESGEDGTNPSLRQGAAQTAIIDRGVRKRGENIQCVCVCLRQRYGCCSSRCSIFFFDCCTVVLRYIQYRYNTVSTVQ